MAVTGHVPSTPPLPLPDAPDALIADPPPPYPSRERRSRRATRSTQHGRIQTSQHTQSSSETQSDYDARASPYTDEDDAEPSETTPFLAPRALSTRQGHHGTFGPGRPRSTSTTSATPSLAHTVLSLFQTEDEMCYRENLDDRHHTSSGEDSGPVLSSQRHGSGFFSRAAWRRYFRPMARRAYYKSFFHLTIINFPYALVAWIYLFVFTVTGTTLLVVLPLGAVLCFLDLLGARAFSRGELALQSRFHAPLAHALPYPPRALFTRYREPNSTELESGQAQITRGGLVREKSFYKNTYAMFTDPTSYQALFYFLIIKPAITLLISIGLVAIAIPLFILVLPAPAVLRAVRKIGIWQANVAVEGLYHAVR